MELLNWTWDLEEGDSTSCSGAVALIWFQLPLFVRRQATLLQVLINVVEARVRRCYRSVLLFRNLSCSVHFQILNYSDCARISCYHMNACSASNCHKSQRNSLQRLHSGLHIVFLQNDFPWGIQRQSNRQLPIHLMMEHSYVPISKLPFRESGTESRKLQRGP